MLIEHGADVAPALQSIYDSYVANVSKFKRDSFYFGCGYDAGKQKYDDYDLCDLREVVGSFLYDVLVGFPQGDATLALVKTKLSLGMFTWHQARFVMRESARTLKVGGLLDVTFRDFDKLLARRAELDSYMFVRYIYGSGMYYGSRRKSCWTPETVAQIANEYRLLEVDDMRGGTGMNTRMVFVRGEGELKRYSPEPDVTYTEDGRMINIGDDFHLIGRT